MTIAVERPVAPAIVGVYRSANASLVEQLVAPALAAGWTTAWWALDEVHDRLASFTVGTGPGEKLPLLNATIELGAAGVRTLVLADDDLRFSNGDVVRTGRAQRTGGLRHRATGARGRQPRQPRHHAGAAALRRSADDVRRGWAARRDLARVVRARYPASRPGGAWAGASSSTGPISAQRAAGSGSSTRARSCTPGKVGQRYDSQRLLAELTAELSERGLTSLAETQRTVQVWRPWRRNPPWVGTEALGRS